MARRSAEPLPARCPGPQGHRVTRRNVPDGLVRIGVLFNPVARAVLGELGSLRNPSAAHALAVLGRATRRGEQTVAECACSRIARSVVKV